MHDLARNCAGGTLHSGIQTRGGGRGGCSSAELRLATAGASSSALSTGKTNSVAATVAEERSEHLAAQAPEWSHPLLVCFSQGAVSVQQLLWFAAVATPSIMEARISAAATGGAASEKAIKPKNRARKFLIILELSTFHATVK
jgi:hypothetical protein